MIPLVPRKPLAGRQKGKNLLPSPTSQMHANAGNPDASSSDWRRYGISRRRQLLEQDAADGGNVFELNYQCRIQGYFALAEKIMSKFNAAFAKGSDIEGTFVMGNRLCHFLTEALPRHPDYMKKDPLVVKLREKSFQSLVQIKKKIDALAIRIDEEQLNHYIMHFFDPFANEDDESTSSNEEEQILPSHDSSPFGSNEPQWENFDGWSFDLPEKVELTETDKVEFVKDLVALSWKDLDESAETEDTSNETFSSSEHSFQASYENEPIYDSGGLDFLKLIASETVRYESDSEAADSWAQECDSEVGSALYSTYSQGNTCDPARIALRELMNKKRLSRTPNCRSTKVDFASDVIQDDENRTLSFDISLGTSSDDEEDHWIPFDINKNQARGPAELERVSL